MIKELLLNVPLVALLTMVFSFSLVYYIIPKIIFMVNYHNLAEDSTERSAHFGAIPSMGGLSFFITLILMIFFIKDFDQDDIALNLVAALTVIFTIGLKDDLALSTPKAKIIVEIFAISFVFFHSGYHLTSLNGLFDIYELPTILIDVFIVIIVLTIINAYNFIDGIDGLASIIGISILSMLGVIFYSVDLDFYLLLCLSLIAILISYMRYNFSNEQKIFMGDTGTLIIGFCIAVLSLKFLTLDIHTISRFTFKQENMIFIIVGIVSVPLFDLIRVSGVRLLNGQSPFKADRNHIHHILLDRGLPHYWISMLLGLLNFVIAIIIICFSSYLNSFQMLLMLIIIFYVFVGVFFRLKLKNVQNSRTKKNKSHLNNE